MKAATGVGVAVALVLAFGWGKAAAPDAPAPEVITKVKVHYRDRDVVKEVKVASYPDACVAAMSRTEVLWENLSDIGGAVSRSKMLINDLQRDAALDDFVAITDEKTALRDQLKIINGHLGDNHEARDEYRSLLAECKQDLADGR